MLTPRQKAKLKQMLALASIPDPEYRAKLQELFNVNSLADEALTNRDYETAAVWIESEIGKAVAEGVTPIETVLTKLEDTWQYTRKALANRSQCPGSGRAYPAPKERPPLKPADPVTQAQRAKIVALRTELAPMEPEVSDWGYIVRMLCSAALAPAPETLDGLTVKQASALINALADRLNYAKQREDRRQEAAEIQRQDAIRQGAAQHTGVKAALTSAQVNYNASNPKPPTETDIHADDEVIPF